MDPDNRKKTAIVTGAGSGIGKAIAMHLAGRGIQVIANDMDARLIEEIKKSDGIDGLTGNMADLNDIRALIDYCIQRFNTVDYLVANAGITHFAPFVDFNEQDFDRILNLNIKGSFFLAQEYVKRKLPGPGGIVLISSVVSIRGYSRLSVYSMTKAALNMLARCLAIELADQKINVNAVAPGATVTERTLLELEDYRKTWSELTPTGRPCEPEDIAKVVGFLLSEDGRQINGQTIIVDGGWSGMGVNPG